jgi:predicted anti-sigma-YlaC factor YlaD
MNCIHDDLIQIYIDGESSPEKTLIVENHIAKCDKCVIRIENQRRLAGNLKKAIDLFAKETIEIPKFEISSKNIKRNILTTKRLSYIIAAASILLFIIVITQKTKMKNFDEIKFEIGSVMEVDANRPVSSFPQVINIIDAKGNYSEFLIK